MKPETKSNFYVRSRNILDDFLSLADRVFNGAFTSEFNPLYRTGTIAVALLSIAIITGLALVFFYRLAEPYESIQAIDSQIWFGRWVRAVHRYASDAAVVAVVLHVLRMFTQKKSWGPRTFAWISGIVLLVLLMVSGWTGFVMVWDTHGQALAISGAKLIDSTGLLADPISRSFNGVQTTPPSSFFFLNLFLHIVLPLAMIFGVWIHTAKMARATWFPHRRMLVKIVVNLILIGIIIPAPLSEKANLLKVPNNFPIDWFFNFWLPLTELYPSLVIGIFLTIIFGLVAFPFVFKPKKSTIPPSSDLDEKKCHGCTQCVLDCPYEAIKMVPRSSGPQISELVAQVDPSKCVSCGLCAASCGPMTIGPAARKGSDQYQFAKSFVSDLQGQGDELSQQTVVIGCLNQGNVLKNIQLYSQHTKNTKIYPVACMGSLHMGTIGYLAVYFKNVLLAACPERNCTNKDAFMLLRDRLSGSREPGLPGRVDSNRVHLMAVGDGEEQKAFRFLKTLEMPKATKLSLGVAVIGGMIILSIIALISSVNPPMANSSEGILRMSWRLAGQASKECRQLSPEELSKKPVHMRSPQECIERRLDYQLTLFINGQEIINESIRPGGFRSDGPLYVAKDISVSAGSHLVKIQFVPLQEDAQDSIRLIFERAIEMHPGEISLVYLSAEQTALHLKQERVIK